MPRANAARKSQSLTRLQARGMKTLGLGQVAVLAVKIQMVSAFRTKGDKGSASLVRLTGQRPDEDDKTHFLKATWLSGGRDTAVGLDLSEVHAQSARRRSAFGRPGNRR